MANGKPIPSPSFTATLQTRLQDWLTGCRLSLVHFSGALRGGTELDASRVGLGVTVVFPGYSFISSFHSVEPWK